MNHLKYFVSGFADKGFKHGKTVELKINDDPGMQGYFLILIEKQKAYLQFKSSKDSLDQAKKMFLPAVRTGHQVNMLLNALKGLKHDRL